MTFLRILSLCLVAKALIAQDSPSTAVLLYLPSPQGAAAFSGTYAGNGRISFASLPPVSPNFDTVRLGDFNGDRITDVIFYNSSNAAAYLGLGTGNGGYNFSGLFWSPGYDFVVTGDLNGDKVTDVVLYHSADGTMYTGISNGSGGFQYLYYLISSGYTKVVVADFSGDGKDDIFLYNASNGLAWLLVSHGDGTYHYNGVSVAPNYTLGKGFDTVVARDINLDGRPDLLLYNSQTGVMVVGIVVSPPGTNEGTNDQTNFTFSTLANPVPGYSSVVLFDYNGDGKADMLLYSKANTYANLVLGNGDGTFSSGTSISLPSSGYDNVFAADLDGDGLGDLLFYSSTNGNAVVGTHPNVGSFTITADYWGTSRIMQAFQPFNQPWRDLQSCVNNPNNTVCSLPNPPGTYHLTLGDTIGVNRQSGNPLTIDGVGSIVYTDGSTVSGIMKIATKIPVKIQNFQLYDPAGYCTKGYNPNPAPKILAIHQADINAWPANPNSYNGPYAVEVYNSAFNCGQGGSYRDAAGIYVDTSQGYSNDLYIHGSYFNWSTVGVGGGNVSGAFQSGLGCDVLSTYPNSTSVTNPRNIVVDKNFWYHTGEGSLTVSHDRWVRISNNQFADDQYVHNSGTDQGGIIYIDECADTVSVDGNTMTGPGGTSACLNLNNCISRTGAIELYGRNVSVGTTAANTMSNYYYEGVSGGNFYNLNISNNTFKDNEWSGFLPYGHIKAWDAAQPDGANYRQGSVLTITNNKISNQALPSTAYAITFPVNGQATPILSTGISISGNTVTNINPQCYESPFNFSAVTFDQFSSWPVCPQ